MDESAVDELRPTQSNRPIKEYGAGDADLEMTRPGNHQQGSESAASSTTGSKKWADRKNFSSFFFWSVNFFEWLQVLLSFGGLYLPRSDKTHSNYWEEQWSIPLESTKRAICHFDSCTHGEKESRRETVYGIEWWLLHWWWTRIVNLLQVGFFVDELLQFPLSDSYVHSFQHNKLSFTDYHPTSKNHKSNIAYYSISLIRSLFMMATLQFMGRTSKIRSIDMKYDRVLMRWMVEGAPGWQKKFHRIAGLPFLILATVEISHALTYMDLTFDYVRFANTVFVAFYPVTAIVLFFFVLIARHCHHLTLICSRGAEIMGTGKYDEEGNKQGGHPVSTPGSGNPEQRQANIYVYKKKKHTCFGLSRLLHFVSFSGDCDHGLAAARAEVEKQMSQLGWTGGKDTKEKGETWVDRWMKCILKSERTEQSRTVPNSAKPLAELLKVMKKDNKFHYKRMKKVAYIYKDNGVEEDVNVYFYQIQLWKSMDSISSQQGNDAVDVSEFDGGWCHDFNINEPHERTITRKVISSILSEETCWLAEESTLSRETNTRANTRGRTGSVAPLVRKRTEQETNETYRKAWSYINEMDNEKRYFKTLKKHMNYVADYIDEIETAKAQILTWCARQGSLIFGFSSQDKGILQLSFSGLVSITIGFSALFYLCLIWMAVRVHTTLASVDDEEDVNISTGYYFAVAVGELVAMVALLAPAVVTNDAVDKFILTITTRFCENSDSELAEETYRDLEWLKARDIGWKIGGYRPSYASIMTLLRYQGVLVGGLLGTLISSIIVQINETDDNDELE